MGNEHILNSWKEISSYLGRGVRTVQRWEAFFGMPVHRPAGKEHSAVVAFASELDTWLQSPRTQVAMRAKMMPIAPLHVRSEQLQRIQIQTDRLLRQTDELMLRHNQLNEQMKRSMDLKNKLKTMQRRQENEKALAILGPTL